jgi:hypothetical protein
MATDKEVKESVMDWLNGLAANFYDKEIGTMSESQWGLHTKTNICCI